ncbi:MAG: DUF1801 domain-containing protein [Deinococcota bacterium]
MQYDAANPEDYLAQLADDWRREKLLVLREMICSSGPDLREFIKYKMLAYGAPDAENTDAEALFHLNAQKSYVSLYVGDIQKIDPDGKLLTGLDMGKGCIRFKKTTKIEDTQIDAFIANAVELWRRGEDVSC